MTKKWYEMSPQWIILYEEAFLQSLASTLPEGARVVNIGGGVGTSTSAILRGVRHLDEATVVSIDVDICPEEMDTLLAQNLFDPDRFETIQGRSQDKEIWSEFEDLDMVFIDGAHTYLGTYNDLNIYSELLKPGGLLVCHDYRDPRQRQVTKAVNQWKNKNNWLMIGLVLYTAAFIKPGGDDEWTIGRVKYE